MKELSKADIIEQKKIESIKEVLASITVQSLDDSIIKDNKIYFKYEGKEFRCKMPYQRDISNAHLEQNKLFLKLIESDVFITKKQLIVKLREKQGIDIDLLEEKKKDIQKELQNVYLDLAITDNASKIEEYKNKIKEIENRHLELFIEIEEYLSPCLEKQKEKNYIEYLTWACTEFKNPDIIEQWDRAWLEFKNFGDTDSKLTSEALKHMSYLLLKTAK